LVNVKIKHQRSSVDNMPNNSDDGDEYYKMRVGPGFSDIQKSTTMVFWASRRKNYYPGMNTRTRQTQYKRDMKDYINVMKTL